MGLFNFSNLIQSEHNEQSQPIKSRISDPSFRDLVRDAVRKHEETKTSDKKEDIVAVEPTLPAIPEPEEVEVAKVIVPEIPTPDKVEEIRPAILPIQEVKSEMNLAENQTYGTFFLKTILNEFSDLLAAGKELEGLENDKKNVATEGVEIEMKKSTEKEARQKVANSLSVLLNNETDSPELLNNALKSYQEYLADFEARYEKLINDKRVENNDLIVKINSKKEQIKKLINQEVGGSQNFQRIKEVVSFCKGQRATALDKIENVSDIMKNEISTNVVKFVEGDLHGSIMFAETGDLIGLMMRIYNAPQK